MRRKIFIAINLDEKTKRFIHGKTEKLATQTADLDMKWTDQANYHITLAFIGYVSDDEISEICSKIKEAIKDTEIFDLSFRTIGWGPNNQTPKMIWLGGEINEELIVLRHKIEEALAGIPTDRKKFKPHITLGRLGRHRPQNAEDFPDISSETNILVPVISLELMESITQKGKKNYYVMESFELL
jgi:2'-5' RNA ligase